MRKPSLPAAILLGSALAIGAVAVYDATVPTRREISTRGLSLAIRQYRRHVSPRLAGTIQCRFVPTCSAYGLGSVEKHGALRGGWKAVKRIARCNPSTKLGTVDLP